MKNKLLAEIRKFVRDRGFDYEKMFWEESIEKVHGLLIENKLFEPTDCPEYEYLGWYYEVILRDIETANLDPVFDVRCAVTNSKVVSPFIRRWMIGKQKFKCRLNHYGNLKFKLSNVQRIQVAHKLSRSKHTVFER